MRGLHARRGRFLIPFASLLVAAACSRTGMEALLLEVEEEDAGIDAGDDGPGASPILPGTPCTPVEETCNGVDDDCDGQIDEMPPIPCPEGGSRYCIAGTLSECPAACDLCRPGTEAVCFVSFCLYWGVQRCAADGKSFSSCKEKNPPPDCMQVAKDHQYSKELEQCCLDAGLCCADDFDLDGDGVTEELLGNCDEVLCHP